MMPYLLGNRGDVVVDDIWCWDSMFRYTLWRRPSEMMGVSCLFVFGVKMEIFSEANQKYLTWHSRLHVSNHPDPNAPTYSRTPL